jgi:hypothetical protein
MQGVEFGNVPFHYFVGHYVSCSEDAIVLNGFKIVIFKHVFVIPIIVIFDLELLLES